MKNTDRNNKSVSKLVIIAGPTGVGKTEVLLQLYDQLNTVLISADSRQIYKEMSIGTAKPTAAQISTTHMQLVDHVSIHQSYNAGEYEGEALKIIKQTHEADRLPIISGGTGLYIKAVCEGLDKFPEVQPNTITVLEEELKGKGIEALQAELLERDPRYHAMIDINNTHRLLRALAVGRDSGKAFSSFLGKDRAPRSFDPLYIVLDRPREELYERINARVLAMMAQGLVEEARSLRPYKHLKALQTVGYKEAFLHLEGDIDEETCISKIQQHTRQYAKRQMTWNRNQFKGQYFSPEDIDGILAYIKAEAAG